jgi:uncharacterized LabA/DUF88 family protein
MGYTWKCNCDVEMTIDILEHCRENAELLIFTGDGDFGSLVEKAAIDKSKVFLISNMQKTYNNLTNSRFAKKLKLLVEKYPEKVIYVDINDWKMRVKKDFKQNENAVQAGGFE